jgi:hypothetical protein
MTRQRVIDEYGWEDGARHGFPLGKFEAEPIYSPYYYDMVMNGCGRDEFDGDICYSIFEITADDRKEFPEIDSDSKYMICHESDEGFWYSEEYSEKEYQNFMEEIEKNQESEETY